MWLVNVYWAPDVNRLIIQCDCGWQLSHPSNYSVVACPYCGRAELWHSVDPVPDDGPWALPVIKAYPPWKNVSPTSEDQ